MPRRLGGTSGVPGYDERVYVRVHSVTEPDGHQRPTQIDWADGRRYPVVSCRLFRAIGRWDFGTLILIWEVELVRHAHRMLYWERGQWFVARKDADRNGERAPGEPIDT